MLKIEFLEELFVIAIALSVVTCAFIQKTKGHMPNSKCLPLYSLVVNLTVGVVFCITFTNVTFPTSLWVGLFSFLGADTLYKTLEGKLLSYDNIISRNKISISKENIINKEKE
ncbi:MAG: hypothetical protein IJA30_00255 [Bacilli bacterium]|nr:hypothetical protein [Bacilli bacterium]